MNKKKFLIKKKLKRRYLIKYFGFYKIPVTIIRESWIVAKLIATSSYKLLKKKNFDHAKQRCL
jgi:hypothetical protein